MPTATELEAGVAAAFAEWRPKLAYPAERDDVRRAVALLKGILIDSTAELIGLTIAWFQRQAFAEDDEFGDFIAHELATNSMQGMKAWINAQDPMGTGGMWSGAGIAKPVSPDDFVHAQKAWGGTLITGLLQQQAGLLNEIIGAGIKDGLAREQIVAKLLREAPNALMPEWRARLIAQTETIRSYNAIHHQNAVKTGAEYIEWLDGQPAACPSCHKLNGQVIPIDPSLPPGAQAYFYDPIRGFTIQHPPCHPGCRCSVAVATLEDYVNQPDFDGSKLVYPTLDPSGLPKPTPKNISTPEIDKWLKSADDNADSYSGSLPWEEYKALVKELGTETSWRETKAKMDALKAQQQSKAPLVLPGPSAAALASLQKMLGPNIQVVSQLPTYPSTTAGNFKKWLDESGVDNALPGLKLLQTYAKEHSQTFLAVSKSLKTEGYEVKHLVAAPKGTFPDPNGKVKLPGVKTPKPAAVTTGLKAAPDAAGGAGMPYMDNDYWNNLTQLSGPKGSNPGGVYEGPDGRQYYIKKYSNVKQAEAEIAAHKVYDLLGIGVPNASIVKMNGQDVYASLLIQGAKNMTAAEMRAWAKAHPVEAARLHIGTVLTANYDVIGLSYDNLMMLPNGKVVVVDTGGSFTFRAQGGAKVYDGQASAFETLLDPAKNKQAADVLGKIYSNPAAIAAARAAVKHLQDHLGQYVTDVQGMGITAATMRTKLTEVALKLDVLERRATQSSVSFGDFVASHDLDIIKQFAARIAADTSIKANPAGERALARRWGGSSTSAEGLYATTMLASHINGITPEQAYVHEMRTRRQKEDDTYLISKWNSIRSSMEAAGMSLEGMLATYREQQPELRKKHPSGRITLYRGMSEGGGVTDGFIKELMDALDRGGPATFRPNWMASFSTYHSTAQSFAGVGGGWSVIVKIEVPIDLVFADKVWLKKNGSYHNESEYLTLGSPSGFTLGYDNVEIWQNGIKKYDEPQRPSMPEPGEQDPYVFSFSEESLNWLASPDLPGYHPPETVEDVPSAP